MESKEADRATPFHTLPIEILTQCLLPLCGRDLFKSVSRVSSFFHAIVHSEGFCKEKFMNDTSALFTSSQRLVLFRFHECSWYVSSTPRFPLGRDILVDLQLIVNTFRIRTLIAHCIAKAKVYLLVWALLDSPHTRGTLCFFANTWWRSGGRMCTWNRAIDSASSSLTHSWVGEPERFWEFARSECYSYYRVVWKNLYIDTLIEEIQKEEDALNASYQGSGETLVGWKRKREEEQPEADVPNPRIKRAAVVVDISSRFMEKLASLLLELIVMENRNCIIEDSDQKLYLFTQSSFLPVRILLKSLPSRFVGNVAKVLDQLMEEWGLGNFTSCFPSERACTDFMEREKAYASKVRGWASEYIRVCGNMLQREKRGFVLTSFPGTSICCILPMQTCSFLKRPLSPVIPFQIWKL